MTNFAIYILFYGQITVKKGSYPHFFPCGNGRRGAGAGDGDGGGFGGQGGAQGGDGDTFYNADYEDKTEQ